MTRNESNLRWWLLVAFVVLHTVGLVKSAHAAPLSQDGCPVIIVETFGERAPQACRVAFCESTWRSGAVSDDGQNVGLFQINRIHGAAASTNPAVNVAFAYRLSRGGWDWSQWSCKP